MDWQMIRALIIAACFASPASAAEQCFSSAIGYLVLAEKHGEARRFLGMTPSGIAVELWIGASGGWTLLKTSSSGTSCIIATGGQGEMYYGAAGVPG
jgi:hypothetical protein